MTGTGDRGNGANEEPTTPTGHPTSHATEHTAEVESSGATHRTRAASSTDLDSYEPGVAPLMASPPSTPSTPTMTRMRAATKSLTPERVMKNVRRGALVVQGTLTLVKDNLLRVEDEDAHVHAHAHIHGDMNGRA
eukprot:CAMPEP_0182580826 /NCGR_PEP_ID=MMETSP1324-20130603/48202_1 /TAXON_ID=236786 /ORGANISM="Florenciella sp., Strain RCC1587" /LENGTH=134 /DNA_ID=CAMNT_0024797109 /DNA_START=86 /DNA_END=487 /DNA_ORIENTATION=+